ncbi:MAG: corrinoid protein [Anaerovoracaceae bacterium]|nr:dimethylamine corrinoid protein 3 [Clostridiales bacterium]
MSLLFEAMKESVLLGEEEEAKKLALEALAEGLNVEEVMEKGFLKGIRQAGDLYEEGEYFLPELVCSADAMKEALAILDSALKERKVEKGTEKKVMMVTVNGDVHDIGKTIVGAMLTANGMNLIDLGADIPNEEVVEAVLREKPDVLGLSALLTSTMEEQGKIIKMLEERNLRDKVKVIVGGAPVTESWAKTIGADGYADSAVTAVNLVRDLFN